MGEQDKFRMKYTVATNFDKEIITEISKYNQDGSFKSVFGKLRSDVLGGGRSSLVLTDVKMSELNEYVELCHKNNLKFNYLLNPSCIGNKDVRPSTHKKIISFLEKLTEFNVDAVTVNSPYLCELIKKRFPKFKVTIGLYANIFEINQVRYWMEMGADELTLGHKINRNFGLLEDILKYTKPYNTSVRLIANNICLRSCPYSNMHGNGQSHASSSNDLSKNAHIDYCMLKCINEKVRNPYNLIASEWIRPEDIKYYEKICEEIGNTNFSIKLLDRTKSTEFLKKVIKAYATRNYDGNLMDIVAWPKNNEVAQSHKVKFGMELFKERYNIKEVLTYLETLDAPNIKIDNKKLDGFLDKFIQHNQCDNKICVAKEELENTGDHSKLYCAYCSSWAKKVLSYDEKEVNEYLLKSDLTKEKLCDSKMFYL